MSREKIWIAGANGRLGRALFETLDRRNEYTVLVTDTDVDITQIQDVMDYVTINRPDYIINCAGVTDPVYCEENPVDAYRVNALGARNIAAASRRVGATTIQISTDDVFDGESRSKLTEFDLPNPKGVYGKSKLAGENFVKEMNPKHMIIRTSWLYGFVENDFVSTVIKKAEAGEVISVPMNQISSPTSAKELSRFIRKLLKTNESGIFHASCEGECSRHEFAKTVIKYAGLKADVQGVVAENGADPTLRPCYTRLDNLMMKMTGVYEMADWKAALKEYMESK